MSEYSFIKESYTENKVGNSIYLSAFLVSLLLPFALIVRDQLSIFGVGVEKYVFAIVFVLWIFSVVQRGSLRKPNAFHILSLFLVIWSLGSIIWSLEPNRTKLILANNLLILILVFVIWDLFRTEKQLELVELSYTLTSLLISCGIVLNFLLQSSYGPGRYSIFGINPNNISLAILLSIPLSWRILQKNNKVNSINWILKVQLISVPIAVLLTGSRQALVALCVVATYPIWTSISSDNFSLPDRKTLSAISIIGFVFVFLTRSILTRFLTIPAEILGGNFGDRLIQWKTGWTFFVHHPLLGIGTKSFNTEITSLIGYSVATDNTYFQVLYELGIIGLVFLLLLILYLFYTDQSGTKYSYGPWTAILFTWCVIAGVNDLIWVPLYWFIFTWFVSEHHSVESYDFRRCLSIINKIGAKEYLPFSK